MCYSRNTRVFHTMISLMFSNLPTCSQNNETSSTQDQSPCDSVFSNSNSKLENWMLENLASANIPDKHVSNRGLDMEGAASLDAVNSEFQIYMTFPGHCTFTETDASRYFR